MGSGPSSASLWHPGPSGGHLRHQALAPPCTIQFPEDGGYNAPISYFFSILSSPTSPEGEQTIAGRATPPALRLTGVLALQHVVGAEELSQVLLLVVSVPVLDHLLELFYQDIALLTARPHVGKARP